MKYADDDDEDQMESHYLIFFVLSNHITTDHCSLSTPLAELSLSFSPAQTLRSGKITKVIFIYIFPKKSK